MPKPITADYSGICGKCGKPYPKGTTLMYRTSEGTTRKWYHYPTCPEVSESTPDVAAVTGITATATSSDPLQVLADALTPHLQDKFSAKIDEAALKAEIEAAVNRITVPTKIDLTLPDGKEVKIEGLQHKAFQDMLSLVGLGHHVYAHGEPGWGKSTAAKQLAESLGRKFGYISLTLQTSDSRLIGYKDANGNYHRTLFRDLYEFGGIFCIDEADNASGNLLTALNSTLANGTGAFPDGMVDRHPDFVCIATGNTVGTGATAGFADRRPLDAAFRDRFTFLEWDEDPKLERTIALQRNSDCGEWIDWVQSVRKYVKANHLRLVVSPRATYNGADLFRSTKWNTEKVAEAVLFKGFDKDSVKRILAAHPYPEVR